MLSKLWKSTLLRWIISIAGIVIIYVVINGVFVGAQNMLNNEDRSKLEQMVEELKSESAVIDTMEQQLTTQDNELTEWNAQINQETDENMHTILVIQYNEKVEVYNLLYNQYDAKITAYNQKVNEAKALSDKIGGKWYISPVRIRN
jgi:hypothetical protein